MRTSSARAVAIAGALYVVSCGREVVELGKGRIERSAPDAAADAAVEAAAKSDEDSQPFAEDCGGDAYPAQGPALEVLVVLDDSATTWVPAVSLDCLTKTCPAATAWDIAVTELKTFVWDARSSGIAVALEYLNNECDVAAHAALDVAFGALPEHAATIEQSLEADRWPVDTPTRPALEGALMAIRTRAAEPGYHARPIILFVTDGWRDEPDCENNTTADVSRVAADGVNGTPSVSTYVFTTLPDFRLDDVAQAGGTGSSIGANLSMPGVLSAKLNSVRDEELAKSPCEYAMPPEFAQLRDPERVNLVHDQIPIARLADASDCDRAAVGWYYDDPSEPTRIFACPSTCESIRAGGSLDIVLNCPTSGI